MKKILLITALLFTSLQAQSPFAFRLLDHKTNGRFTVPVEPNAWAGAQLNYPLYGDREAFDLSFGLTGKFVIDFTELQLGRTWYLLTYGNFGLPNYNHISIFNNTVNADEGLNFGVQAYSVFGKIYRKAITTSILASAKVNSFGNTQIVSYRFGAGFEASLSDGGLPLLFNLTPAYILLADKKEFAMAQTENVGRGVWTADSYVILPVGDKLGLLVQSTFAENVKPLYRAGVIIAMGM